MVVWDGWDANTADVHMGEFSDFTGLGIRRGERVASGLCLGANFAHSFWVVIKDKAL